MERWLLIAATLFAAIGGVLGMISVHRGRRSPGTVFWMGATFAVQLGFLWMRGQARGACPLMGTGETLAFLAWSLTLCYLAVGPTYRLSLLGVFTAPVVVVLQVLALAPGLMEVNPEPLASTNGWRETHAAMSVLGYGALALAAVAAVMFLTLDYQLKERHLSSGLFRNMPPVRELLVSMQRLLWMGMGVLTIGVAAGFMMPKDGEAARAHLLTAVAVWFAYLVLIGVKQWFGMTGRRFSMAVVAMFVVSLSVFAFV